MDIDNVLPATLVKSILAATAVSSISDEDLDKAVKTVLVAQPKAVEDYKKGKEQALGFLLGQVMKIVKGNAGLVREKIRMLIK